MKNKRLASLRGKWWRMTCGIMQKTLPPHGKRLMFLGSLFAVIRSTPLHDLDFDELNKALNLTPRLDAFRLPCYMASRIFNENFRGACKEDIFPIDMILEEMPGWLRYDELSKIRNDLEVVASIAKNA